MLQRATTIRAVPAALRELAEIHARYNPLVAQVLRDVADGVEQVIARDADAVLSMREAAEEWNWNAEALARHVKRSPGLNANPDPDGPPLIRRGDLLTVPKGRGVRARRAPATSAVATPAADSATTKFGTIYNRAVGAQRKAG